MQLADRQAEGRTEGDTLAALDPHHAAAPQTVRSASHLAGILHADSPSAAASMLFHSTFPARAFMRWRYPGKAAWPLAALYPYRWMVQAGKAGALVGGASRVHRGEAP